MTANTKMSLEQKYLLVEFVEGNELITRGKVAFPNSTKELQEQWQIITEKFNACNGSKKSWKEWRRSWQDMRAKTKQKAARIRTELRLKTGGGPPKEEKLTDIQEKVLSLMSTASVHGLEDTEKSAVITDESECIIVECDTPCRAQSVIGDAGPDTSVIFVSPPAIAATPYSSALSPASISTSLMPTVISTSLISEISYSAKCSPPPVPNDPLTSDSQINIFHDTENKTPSMKKAPLKRKLSLHSPYPSKCTKRRKDSTKISSISEDLLGLEERKLKVQENTLAFEKEAHEKTLAFEKEKFMFMKSYKERKLKALQDIAMALDTFSK